VEAIDQELRGLIDEEDIALCLCDAALPDCPIIGSLLDFQIFTGRTYAEDIGRNCRHLNSGCSNNRASMCFLRTLSASQDNANAFSQMFPSGAKFVLENRRSVRFLKTKKVTFQNFLLVFPVTERASGRVLLAAIQADLTFFSFDQRLGLLSSIRQRLVEGDLSGLFQRFLVVCVERAWSGSRVPRMPVPDRADLSNTPSNGEKQRPAGSMLCELLDVCDAIEKSVEPQNFDHGLNLARMCKSRTKSMEEFTTRLQHILDRWTVWMRERDVLDSPVPTERRNRSPDPGFKGG